MTNIEQLLRDSIEDGVFSRKEKREIKQHIQEANYNEVDFNNLRNKIDEIAKEYQDKISTEGLINWLSATTRLTFKGRKGIPAKTEAYFSPGVSVKNVIIEHLKSAKDCIKVCVFTISDSQISEEILAAHRRGLDVKIITDDEKVFDIGSDIDFFKKHHIPIKVDHSRHHMHHKFCIFDNKVLITGSYNWTNSAANYNQENLLLTEKKAAVDQYLKEFNKLWDAFEHYEGPELDQRPKTFTP